MHWAKCTAISFVVEYPAELCHVKEYVSKLGEHNGAEFVAAGVAAVQVLHNLPTDHPLKLCNREYQLADNTPTMTVFSNLMRLVFWKSRTAMGVAAAGNHSGYAVQGPRGVGKSTVLRIVALIVSLLLDGAVVAYVDYERASDSKHDPCTVLSAAAAEKGIYVAPCTMEDASDPVCAIQDLCEQLMKQQAFPVIIADGACTAYRDDRVWGQLDAMATMGYTAVVLADSSAKLPALMMAQSRHRALIEREWGYAVMRDSINITKVKLLRMGFLTTIAQYRAVIGASTSDAEIYRLHFCTGGRYSSLRSSVKLELPSEGSAEFIVMSALYRAQPIEPDPFNMAAISQTTVAAALRAAGVEHGRSLEALLVDMQDTGLLYQRPSDGMITWGTPALWDCMRAADCKDN